MSRNGSYAKSMNGIVSFDDGDGTVIEGSELSTTTVNCTTLNASSKVDTSQLFTDFITTNENANISVISETKFNDDVYVDNIYANTGTILLKNNTSITGSLALTSTIQTASIEGRGIGGVASPLNIGQSNDYTSSINIGRDAITAGGFVFPAIPVKTTYIPTSNFDICNKLYVDNATAGTNILSLNNTFTGTTNTFQNIVANTGITLPTATNSIDTNTAGATVSLFNSLTSGILHVGKNIVGGFGILNLCNSIFITPNSIASGQTSDVSLFNSIGGTIGKIRMATNLIISEGAIDCTSVTDSIKLFFKLTTGTLSIGESMTNTGTIIIGGISSTVKIFKAFQFFVNTVNNSDDIQYIGTKNKIELLNTLSTTKTLNFGGTSTMNVGLASTTPGTVNINGIVNIGRVSATPDTITINGKVNSRASLSTTSKRIFGYTRHVVHDGASGNYNFTDQDRNQDFYIIVIGSFDCSVVFPAAIGGQVVYIRNAMNGTRINNVITTSGNNILQAGGGATNMVTMQTNTGMMLYCDGGNWIVMMVYP